MDIHKEITVMKRYGLLGLLIGVLLVFSSTLLSVSAQDTNVPDGVCGPSAPEGGVVYVITTSSGKNVPAVNPGHGQGPDFTAGTTVAYMSVSCDRHTTFLEVVATNGEHVWLPDHWGNSVKIWNTSPVVESVVTQEPTPQVGQAATATPSPLPSAFPGGCTPYVATLPGQIATVPVEPNINVRIREGAGKNFPVKALACVGSTMLVVGWTADKSWYQIVFENSLGWVSASFVEVSASPSATPSATSVGPTPTPMPEMTATVTPSPCEAALPCQLSIGAIGHNDNQFGDTHVRTDSTDPDSQMDVVLTGQFQVIGGPECHDSPKHDVVICWWNISFTPRGFKDNIVTGWVPEGIPGQRWLVPGPA